MEQIEKLTQRVEDLEIALAQAMSTIEKLTKKRRKVVTEEAEKAFDDFWAEYPRKIGKGAARKAFHAAECDKILDQILVSVTAQKDCPSWTKDDGQFIPHPATWIRQQRWLDEGTKKEERFTQSF